MDLAALIHSKTRACRVYRVAREQHGNDTWVPGQLIRRKWSAAKRTRSLKQLARTLLREKAKLEDAK